MWRLYTLHNVWRTLSYITLSKCVHYLICTLLMYKKFYRRCRSDSSISFAFCFGDSGMDCICISIPCKCLYALKSSLLICGYILFACNIMRSCILRIDLLLGLFLVELFCCVSEHGVIVNDAWHVSMVGVKLYGCMSAPP
jgi:hypothetical protein